MIGMERAEPILTSGRGIRAPLGGVGHEIGFVVDLENANRMLGTADTRTITDVMTGTMGVVEDVMKAMPRQRQTDTIESVGGILPRGGEGTNRSAQPQPRYNKET